MFRHSANSLKNEKKQNDKESIKIEVDGTEFMKFNGQDMTNKVTECRTPIIVTHFMQKHSRKRITTEEAARIISKMNEQEVKPFLFPAHGNQQVLVEALAALEKVMIPG